MIASDIQAVLLQVKWNLVSWTTHSIKVYVVVVVLSSLSVYNSEKISFLCDQRRGFL